MENQLGARFLPVSSFPPASQTPRRPRLQFLGPHALGGLWSSPRKRSSKLHRIPVQSPWGEGLAQLDRPTQMKAKGYLPCRELGLPLCGFSPDAWPCLCWFESNRSLSPRLRNRKEILSSCSLMLPTAVSPTIQSRFCPLGKWIRVSTARLVWNWCSLCLFKPCYHSPRD